jgi:hypothetical protein
MHRQLDVTASTTFDFLDARVTGDGWSEESIAVLDVESPRDEETVTLALELDPVDVKRLEPHAETVPLTPEQARELAAELETAADAAERGEALTSRRG